MNIHIWHITQCVLKIYIQKITISIGVNVTYIGVYACDPVAFLLETDILNQNDIRDVYEGNMVNQNGKEEV